MEAPEVVWQIGWQRSNCSPEPQPILISSPLTQ